MGNCLRYESPRRGAGDDWPEEEETSRNNHQSNYEGKEQNKDQDGIYGSSSEIKIKITKKQLEKLLGKVNVQELTVQQVLAYLMKYRKDGYEADRQSWRPALQSIPESNLD